MPVRVRSFTSSDADYAAWIDVQNSVSPDNPRTVEQMRERDRNREKRMRLERFVAERDGTVVGVACWFHLPFLFHPRRLMVSAWVRPEEQGRGIGRWLFETVLDDAEEAVQPVSLRACSREDRARSVRFLTDRGFEEECRGFESRLDLATFDESPFSDAGQRVEDSGIRLVSMADARDEEEFERWMRGIHVVDCEASKDIPFPEPVTPEPFEAWRKFVQDSSFIDRGMILALDGDEVVGTTMLFTATEPHMLDTGMTGVLRSHRRRGIALALKLRAAATARELGATVIRTHNDEPNRAMLSINEAMGFEKLPAFIDFYRSVRPDEDEHLARQAAAADATPTTSR